MYPASVLQIISIKASKALTFRKSSILLGVTLTLIILLFALGNAGVRNTSFLLSVAQSTDADGDGLSDNVEDDLGTDKNNKFGDKDNDGLYDFEEFLDTYGTPGNDEDTPKYDYNDSQPMMMS